ncbi:MAG TPA: glycosyltransferase family 39 protein [Mycobacteriales bacterium]|nr:glycosyltransferase family 39 protein [Mycobacteriales bacterium]
MSVTDAPEGSIGSSAILRQRPAGPDELRVLRRRDWATVGIVAAVLVGIALRFLSRGPLWLDEAQSVAIARQPLDHLAAALRHDGAPPLYYVLLHGWMKLFGTSTFAVRSLSAVPAVLALPATLRLGRRFGGDAVGIAAVTLLAVSPFAVRYAVETRMYSLLLLLGVLGAHAVLSVHRHRTTRAALGVALVSSAMLYTHYYAVFVLTVLGAAELWIWWRRRDGAALAVVAGVVAGGLTFLPWLPDFLYQSRHTGAPWNSPPDANAVIGTIDSWMGGARPAAQLASLIALGCVVVALIGQRGRRGQVVLQTRIAPEPARLFGVVVGALVLAIVVDGATQQAYAPRYLSFGAALFLVVVGCGIAVLPSRRARRIMLALLVVADLSVCLENAWQPRTQAGEVAAVLNAKARPGDVIVYCPDQTGPSTSRLLHTSARQLVFPNFGSPKVVDWVDYRDRIADADPTKFGNAIDKLAGHHRVWLVWSLQVKPLTKDCAGLIDHFVASRGLPAQPVTRHPEFSETMSLNEYGPPRHG